MIDWNNKNATKFYGNGLELWWAYTSEINCSFYMVWSNKTKRYILNIYIRDSGSNFAPKIRTAAAIAAKGRR
jgi:hypothetical protein